MAGCFEGAARSAPRRRSTARCPQEEQVRPLRTFVISGCTRSDCPRLSDASVAADENCADNDNFEINENAAYCEDAANDQNCENYEDLVNEDENDEICENDYYDNPPEVDPPLCTKDIHAADHGRSTASRGPCPRKDVIAKLAPTTDVVGIREVIEQVANEEITTAAELIFCLTPYVSDRCAVFREVLEKELSFFRDIVNDTVDRRIQDEADVMLNTQNDIKNKFRSLSDAMMQRTMRIRQRLYEISPTFDWAHDGRDRAKILKYIISPHSRNLTKDDTQGTQAETTNIMDKLIHQVFMRGQWLKKELTRLQEENDNLEFFLDKFRVLADERKEQESHVPKMLGRERKQLERELRSLRKTYKKNLEIINALYIEHHRCIMPESETSLAD